VFLEAGVERPVGLSCVFNVAGGAGDLINPGFFIFIYMGVWGVFPSIVFSVCFLWSR
jgi:hypothetical protein